MNKLIKFLSKHKKLRNVLLTTTAGLTLYSCGSSNEISNNQKTPFSDSLTTKIHELQTTLDNHNLHLDSLYLDINKNLLDSNYLSTESRNEIETEVATLSDKLGIKDTNYQELGSQTLLAEKQDTTKVKTSEINSSNKILAEKENNQSSNMALGFTDTTLQFKEVINPVKYTVKDKDTTWKIAKTQLIKEGTPTPNNNQISERVVNISNWNKIDKNTDLGCMKDKKYTLGCKDGLYPDLIFPGNEFIVGYEKTKEYSTLKKIEPVKQDSIKTQIAQPDTTTLNTTITDSLTAQSDTIKTVTKYQPTTLDTTITDTITVQPDTTTAKSDTIKTSIQKTKEIIPEYLSQTKELTDSLDSLSCKIDEGLFNSTDRLKFIKNLYKVDRLYNQLNKKDSQNSTVDSTLLVTEDFMRNLMDMTINTLKKDYNLGETDLLLDLPKKESQKNLESELNFGSRIMDYCYDMLIDYPKFPIEIQNEQPDTIKIDDIHTNLEETITDSLPYFQNQINIYNTEIDSVLPQYKTMKNTYDSLTVRFKELKDELRPIKDNKKELEKKKQEIREYKQLKKQRTYLRNELKSQRDCLLNKRDKRDSIEEKIQQYNSKQDSSKTTPQDNSTYEFNKPLQTEWATIGNKDYKQGRDGRWRVKQANVKGPGVYASNKSAYTAGMMGEREYNDFLIKQRI
ncbi:hypothetical protein ISS04_00960 [Candidatus Woesearchaeota archaeon]|nr:hypothetical protein [Candidatus Woesearchaeota archaeon]